MSSSGYVLMTWNLDLGNIFTPQIQSRGYLVGAHNLRWIYAIVSLELASTSVIGCPTKVIYQN